MTWSRMWPMKTIRRKQTKREGQAELQSLGKASMYQV